MGLYSLGTLEEEVLALRGGVGINSTDGTVDLHAIMKVLMIVKDFQGTPPYSRVQNIAMLSTSQIW